MNTENQNIEFKESWRDEYLKWICGFANAQGGKLYIGIDDNGNVVGVKNAKKQAETEILRAFGIQGDFANSEDLDIFSEGDGNAALLAISVLMLYEPEDDEYDDDDFNS